MSGWRSVAPTVVAAVAVLDPFAFFQPTLRLEPADRTALLNGSAFARTVPAPPGNVAIVGVVPIRIDGARLVRWIRDISAMKKSDVVQQIGRFSATPSLADVQGLTMDTADIDEVATCRPASCGVKLTPDEIGRIRSALTVDPHSAGAAVQRAFREVVVARAADYLREGRTGVEAPAFLDANWPEVGRELRDYPRCDLAGAESFLYWAKDAYGGKPIVSITHVTIVRGGPTHGPDVLVVGRQVFATHYTDAAWSVTALVRDEQTSYLVYVNQSDIDLLDSWYGGLVRRVVERRLRGEAVDVLNGIRQRLESGDPPGRPGE